MTAVKLVKMERQGLFLAVSMICTMAIGFFKQMNEHKKLVLYVTKKQPSMSTENFENEDFNLNSDVKKMLRMLRYSKCRENRKCEYV